MITDKSKPLTAREGVIKRLAEETAAFIKENPQIRLVIGHGSGSFGHAIASKFQTQNGVRTEAEWQGFAEVWAAARQLDQTVIRFFTDAGLPVIAFPPSAGVISSSKKLRSWDVRPIQAALSHGLIPVVQGDVVFDTTLGGTIFSTEQVFQYLAQELHPARILLAGLDSGVYQDPDQSNKIIQLITPSSFQSVAAGLSGSSMTDVTGGMLSKVKTMVALVEEMPQLTVQIFAAAQPGDLAKAFAGENIGTLIHS